MKRLLVAVALIAIALVFIAPGLRTGDASSHPPATIALDTGGDVSESIQSAGGDALILSRGRNGHFTADVTVNGAAFPMIVDSGASVIVLRREDALAAGISTFSGEFTGTAQTAGGPVRTKSVTLDRVVIGGIERRNILAAVVDTELPVSLLGQSFLSRLDEVRITGDEMQIR